MKTVRELPSNRDLVMGYDARVFSNNRLLDQPVYREKFAFNLNSANLSSVDTAIWSSVFESEKEGTLKRPVYTGSQGLWSDFGVLLEHVDARRQDHVLIAIQYVPTDRSELALHEWLEKKRRRLH